MKEKFEFMSGFAYKSFFYGRVRAGTFTSHFPSGKFYIKKPRFYILSNAEKKRIKTNVRYDAHNIAY